MDKICNDCGMGYDDAQRLTFCPHDEIMPADDLARKDQGIALLGKEVRFNHQPDGPWYRICSVGFRGMVQIEGIPGEFAPHLFVSR